MRNGRERQWLSFFFSPSLSSLFVFPCLRSELESCDPKERIAGQRWESCRAPATVTVPRSASPRCFLLQQGTSEFSSITANVTTPPTSKPGPVPGKNTKTPTAALTYL